VLCKVILRLYINLAASTPTTPPHATHRYHSHILSHPLLPSIIALGRLFVIPVSDQPDPDDQTLVLDIVTLCHALYPPLVVGSEHSELISLVIDASKRQDERLQQLSLSTLCEWARCSPRVLPFLASRLHSTFPSLQLSALDVWLRLTKDCEDGEVLEAALDAVPRFVALAASKRTDVADGAMTVLVNVASQKEAREQMWRTKGFVKGIRLQLTGRASPVAVVRLLRCLALSPELAEPMWKEGLVDDALHLLYSRQQRMQQQRQQVEEKAQLREVNQQQRASQASADTELQCGLYRYLRNLVSVKIETDGADDDLSNERWESRQWTIMQSSVADSVFATHRTIARHITGSPPFQHLLDTDTALLGPLTMDAARLLAAVIVAIAGGRSGEEGSVEEDDERRQAGTEATDAYFVTTAPSVLALLTRLVLSDRFEDQYAAATAYLCSVSVPPPMWRSEDAVCEIRRCLLSELHRSGSVYVASKVAVALTAMRRQDATWQWQSSERQLLADVSERWTARLERQRAEEDVSDPSDDFTILSQLQQTLQHLLSDDSVHNNSALLAETSITLST